MSANKYSNLPYIDTAPDIYETDDVFPSSHAKDGDSSDEEAALPTRSTKDRNGAGISSKEELDSSNLIGTEEASKRFKKAERKYRSRPHYAYPPSPDSPTSPTTHRPVPLSQRLRALQNELAALETELADPSNPLLAKEREQDNVDPGELIRGLVDVRGRLEKISKGKEGRGRLVNVVLGNEEDEHRRKADGVQKDGEGKKKDHEKGKIPDVRSVVEMDRRVGELEKLVGSSSTALDEISPLPPPLLPLITRLNTQLTLLTQPRHVDSISRRLKLLLTDLDRTSASQQHASHHRRQNSQSSSAAAPPANSAVQEQLLPLLTRLGPSLPQIPHILTRLRTLSSLHTAAAEFQGTLEGLEEEQKKMREALEELNGAVKTVERSLDENQGLVKGNVGGLEERIDGLLRRLEVLSR
ncbi:hypothetical protein PILCRDRAFT_195 [Piloderma croceum F 1598]|uniref:Dynamitin n=1 Tax=Piloderma croceum (strain F 1598) TaxID=765440 RepID=A0A0C3CQZ2_PILCF|nr:hypothetical protein PILCRDRAFT_195 [Piloderma croceum F 1598]